MIHVTRSHPAVLYMVLVVFNVFLHNFTEGQATRLNISSRGCYIERPGQSKLKTGEECNHLSKDQGRHAQFDLK